MPCFAFAGVHLIVIHFPIYEKLNRKSERFKGHSLIHWSMLQFFWWNKLWFRVKHEERGAFWTCMTNLMKVFLRISYLYIKPTSSSIWLCCCCIRGQLNWESLWTEEWDWMRFFAFTISTFLPPPSRFSLIANQKSVSRLEDPGLLFSVPLPSVSS